MSAAIDAVERPLIHDGTAVCVVWGVVKGASSKWSLGTIRAALLLMTSYFKISLGRLRRLS
jgi:hypothetical protein